MDLKSVFRRPADIRYRKVQTEWVVVRQSSAEVLVLNEWAGRVLDLLDGERTLSDVVQVLASEYDSDLETLRTDVVEFASELRDAGLTEPGEAAS